MNSPGGAHDHIAIRIAGYAPRDSTHGRALAEFAETLRTRSGGRIEAEILWNILDEGYPAATLLDMVERGELFVCYFSTSYLAERVPQLGLLDTPFLFDRLEEAHRALDGELGEALTAATEEATGFSVLGYWDNGFRHLTNRLHPVRTPDDCRGMRIRVQPNATHEAMIEAWGATPVAVDLGEAVELIATGEVDAQENPLANTAAYGVDRVHRFATMTAHLYGARGLYAHAATMRRLPTRDVELVHGAARAAIDFQRRLAAERETELRRRLTDAGMEFVDLSLTERERFVAAGRGVADGVRARVGRDLFDLARR